MECETSGFFRPSVGYSVNPTWTIGNSPVPLVTAKFKGPAGDYIIRVDHDEGDVLGYTGSSEYMLEDTSLTIHTRDPNEDISCIHYSSTGEAGTHPLKFTVSRSEGFVRMASNDRGIGSAGANLITWSDRGWSRLEEGKFVHGGEDQLYAVSGHIGLGSGGIMNLDTGETIRLPVARSVTCTDTGFWLIEDSGEASYMEHWSSKVNLLGFESKFVCLRSGVAYFLTTGKGYSMETVFGRRSQVIRDSNGQLHDFEPEGLFSTDCSVYTWSGNRIARSSEGDYVCMQGVPEQTWISGTGSGKAAYFLSSSSRIFKFEDDKWTFVSTVPGDVHKIHYHVDGLWTLGDHTVRLIPKEDRVQTTEFPMRVQDMDAPCASDMIMWVAPLIAMVLVVTLFVYAYRSYHVPKRTRLKRSDD